MSQAPATRNLEAFYVWNASDGELTREMYRCLEACGAVGKLAVALFRANKCSARAKVYRGGIRGQGSYKSMAYQRKEWSMGEVCKVLLGTSELGLTWGWKKDPAEGFHSWVLYVDLPGAGQVSFHARTRGQGPDYPHEWDGKRASSERICQFCNDVLKGREL
jgi:hypothetical protein